MESYGIEMQGKFIIEKLATGIRRIKEQYMDQETKPGFLVSENVVIVILPFVDNSISRESDPGLKLRDISTVEDKEKTVYDLILRNPMIGRKEIQSYIDLEKTQTIELLNKLRDLGLIIKTGNGPATGYKVLK